MVRSGPVRDEVQRDVQRLAGADEVQRHVHAAGCGRADPAGQAVAVGHRDGAQLAEERVPGWAGRADHGGTPAHRELDGHDADAAGRAVHQHGVALVHIGRGQRVPGGDPGEHQPAGWGPVQRGAWAPGRPPGRPGRRRTRRVPGTRSLRRLPRIGPAGPTASGPAAVTTRTPRRRAASEPAGSAPIRPLYCFQLTGFTPAAGTWIRALDGPACLPARPPRTAPRDRRTRSRSRQLT